MGGRLLPRPDKLHHIVYELYPAEWSPGDFFITCTNGNSVSSQILCNRHSRLLLMLCGGGHHHRTVSFPAAHMEVAWWDAFFNLSG